MAFLGSSKSSKSTVNYATDNSQDNRQTDNKVAAAEGSNVFSAGGGSIVNKSGSIETGNNSAVTLNQTSDRAFDTVDRVIGQASFGLQQAADSVSKIAQDSNASIGRISETNALNLSTIAKYVPYIVAGVVILGAVYLYTKKAK